MPAPVSSEPFRALAASLKEGGFSSHAARLEAVLNGVYTTSTELIGDLGAVVLDVRRQCEPLNAEQKELVRRCLREVRKAWPGFGMFDGLPDPRALLLLAIAAAAVLAAFWRGPIPQDPGYHMFADSRGFAGVPNFGDVLSNLPFLIVGLYGLSRVRRLAHPEVAGAYAALCAGVMLVSAGSAYYHWSPSTPTLFWDRLPMTVAFMALFSMMLEERVIKQRGTLMPLIAAGIASAVYWHWTEQRGAGDLRPYLLVQFLPLMLMPVILALYPGRYLRNGPLYAAFALYVGAKVFELGDRRVLEAVALMSGHSIKHLLAAAATLCIVDAVDERGN